MTRARQPTLTLEREATDREVQEMEASRGKTLPRPQYVEEPIALIDGFKALYAENDLRSLLVLELEEKVKQFELADIDTLLF